MFKFFQLLDRLHDYSQKPGHSDYASTYRKKQLSIDEFIKDGKVFTADATVEVVHDPTNHPDKIETYSVREYLEWLLNLPRARALKGLKDIDSISFILLEQPRLMGYDPSAVRAGSLDVKFTTAYRFVEWGSGGLGKLDPELLRTGTASTVHDEVLNRDFDCTVVFDTAATDKDGMPVTAAGLRVKKIKVAHRHFSNGQLTLLEK